LVLQPEYLDNGLREDILFDDARNLSFFLQQLIADFGGKAGNFCWGNGAEG
jgi:hypothetical protein